MCGIFRLASLEDSLAKEYIFKNVNRKSEWKSDSRFLQSNICILIMMYLKELR